MATVTALPKDRRSQGPWLLIAGVVALILGLIGLYFTLGLTVVSVLWYGVLLLAAGVMQCIESLGIGTAEGGKSQRIPGIVLGLIYAAAGLWAIFNPERVTLVLTLVLGIALIASGVLKASWYFFDKSKRSTGALMLAGVISLVLGSLLIAQWPFSGAWAVGLLISCDLLAHGLALSWAGLKNTRA
ncbi:HdeD family acid-resistance protein [Microvirga terricola]|uniref:HdeD family acid-resistance protein n=1 Tax=Microvirga terricola TaxID=2719797 RepID=A0ABX0VE53_9HYPH|nr:DUF308 domain-containing protein [Microvirga terricola]NIX77771.1 hypothetical protein [Microvirga terricola]